MQPLLTLLLICGSSVAFALPKLGEAVVYDMTTQGQTFQSERTLIGVDLNNDQCIEQWNIVGSNNPPSQNTVKCSDLDFAPYTDEHCAKAHGTINNVAVPAGTFRACSIADEKGGIVDIADVPFGIVHLRALDQEGNWAVVDLRSYTVDAQ